KATVPEAKIRAHEQPTVRPGVTPIGSVARNGRATVEGRVHSLEIRPVEHSCVLACLVSDATGELTAPFYGRTHIPGPEPGRTTQFTAGVATKDAAAVMVNPAYELLS